MCLCVGARHLFPPLLVKQHRACFTFNLTPSSVLSPFQNRLFFLYQFQMEAHYAAAAHRDSTGTFIGLVFVVQLIWIRVMK